MSGNRSNALSVAMKNRRFYRTWVKTTEIPQGQNKVHAAGALARYNPCLEKEVKNFDTTGDEFVVFNGTAGSIVLDYSLFNPDQGTGSNQRESNGAVMMRFLARIIFVKKPIKSVIKVDESILGTEFYTGQSNGGLVRVIVFVDESSNGIRSPWYDPIQPSTHPGPMASDTFNAFYNDSEEGRYRIFYDNTFSINDLVGQGRVWGPEPVSGEPTNFLSAFYSPGAVSFAEIRIDLEELTSTFGLAGAPVAAPEPLTNNLQILFRANDNQFCQITAKIDTRVDFVDSV